MALASLSHSPVSRTSVAAGGATPGAAADYITRSSALTSLVGSIPDAPTLDITTVRRWARSFEQIDTRKNARLCDKLIVALPRELTEAQRLDLLRDFADRLGQGRISWVAAVHAGGKDAENPHAHIILRDRDRLDPTKRVIGTTSKGSTEMIRQAWQAATNDALERAGRAERIDMRSYARQGKDQLPTVHLGATATAQERRGEATDRGDANRRIEAINRAHSQGAQVLSQATQIVTDLTARLQDQPTIATRIEASDVIEQLEAQFGLGLSDVEEPQREPEIVTDRPTVAPERAWIAVKDVIQRLEDHADALAELMPQDELRAAAATLHEALENKIDRVAYLRQHIGTFVDDLRAIVQACRAELTKAYERIRDAAAKILPPQQDLVSAPVEPSKESVATPQIEAPEPEAQPHPERVRQPERLVPPIISTRTFTGVRIVSATAKERLSGTFVEVQRCRYKGETQIVAVVELSDKSRVGFRDITSFERCKMGEKIDVEQRGTETVVQPKLVRFEIVSPAAHARELEGIYRGTTRDGVALVEGRDGGTLGFPDHSGIFAAFTVGDACRATMRDGELVVMDADQIAHEAQSPQAHGAEIQNDFGLE